LEEQLLGHILAAEDTQTTELHSMFAGFDDDDDRFLCGGTPGDDVAWLDIPSVECALNRRVPSAETGFGLSTGCICEMYEGIAEKTRATSYILSRRDV